MAQPTIEPNDLLLFARVVEAGSFSRAAERVGMPKSTVSRRLAELERRLGERLLLRTTRKLALTDFGQNVLDHARQVATEVDGALALALHRQAKPSGRLRVTMPGDIATLALGPMLANFVQSHPAIALEVDLSPRHVDLIGENFDLALRMGDLPDDSQLAARRVALFTGGLYASPGYLRTHGEPSAPAVLEELHGLMILSRGGEPMPWVLHHEGDGAIWTGAPRERTLANSPDLLTRLALAGTGIAAVSDFYVAPYVARGELQRVLPGWCVKPAPAWAVFPGRRLMPARTRVFIDAVIEALKPCDDHAAMQAAQHRAAASGIGSTGPSIAALRPSAGGIDMKQQQPDRSADARGDTGTGADAHRGRAREPGRDGDVGGIPSTVDAGMRDQLDVEREPTTERAMGREHVRDGASSTRPAGAGRRDGDAERGEGEPPRRRATDADVNDEHPVKSLGEAISDAVIDAPRSTPDRPRE